MEATTSSKPGIDVARLLVILVLCAASFGAGYIWANAALPSQTVVEYERQVMMVRFPPGAGMTELNEALAAGYEIESQHDRQSKVGSANYTFTDYYLRRPR